MWRLQKGLRAFQSPLLPSTPSNEKRGTSLFADRRALAWGGAACTAIALVALLSCASPFPFATLFAGGGAPQAIAPQNYFAIVTTSYNVADAPGRDREYALALPYFFSHFPRRVAGLVSASAPWPRAARHQWAHLSYFVPPAGLTQKSAMESAGLRQLVRELAAGVPLDDDAVVFKASGRYQVARNDFLEDVLANPQYDVWAKPFGAWALSERGEHVITPGDAKVFTFLFAMRWRFFRDLFANVDIEKLETHDTVPSKGWRGYDIETYVMDYIREKGLRLWRAQYLHVVANIDNRGFLNYF